MSDTPALRLPSLGIGTVPLGNLYQPVSDDEAEQALQAGFAAGVRMYDTAPVYGFGIAERRLGKALTSWPRQDVLLSTKVGRLLRAGAPADPAMAPGGTPLFAQTPDVSPVFDFSYDGAMRSLEESLNRLGTDHIDIVYIHDPDDHFGQAVAGAYRALDQLRAEHVVAAVGVGMTQAAVLTRFVCEVDLDCVLLAGRYTLLDQSAETDLLPACLQRGVRVVLGGVFNSGVLADPFAATTYDYQPAAPDVLARARRCHEICAGHHVPLAAAAIHFGLRHPAVAAVLVGVRSAHEAVQNAELAATAVPDDLWADLTTAGLIGGQR
jgi:D-threo-aldose 1-dehydrogenase